MKTGTVQKPLDPSEQAEFWAAMHQQFPHDPDPAAVRRYLKKKATLGRDWRGLIGQPLPVVDVDNWQDFFKRKFGRRFDLGGLYIPQKPAYPCRAIINPRDGLTNNDVFDAFTKTLDGKTWRYANDLNTVEDVITRPEGPHVVWVRDVIEADEEMANVSADQITERGINTVTFFDRQMDGLKVFDEGRGHLDIQNVTLCSGSRSSDGGVPGAGWLDGEFYVHAYRPGYSDSCLRARVAVS